MVSTRRSTDGRVTKIVQRKSRLQFGILPPEIKMMIFKNLNLREKKNVGLVCKDWFDVVSCLMKREVVLSDSTLEVVKKSTIRPVDSLKVVNFKATNIIRSTSRQDTIPAARSLHLKYGNSQDNVVKLLRYSCSNVEKLILDDLSLENFRVYKITTVIPNINWNVLHHLHLLIPESMNMFGYWKTRKHRNHIGMLGRFLEKLSAPSLRDVTLRFLNPHALYRFGQSLYLVEIEKLYSAFYTFLSNHSESLTGVDAYLRGRQFFPQLNAQETRDQMALMKLESLVLNFDIDNEDVAYYLCEAGSRLKRLIFDKTFSIITRIRDVPTVFLDTINRNKTTIESLVLRRVSVEGNWFNGFDNLKHLEILGWNPTKLDIKYSLPNLKTFLMDIYFIHPQPSPVIAVDQILTWISRGMQNIENLSLNFNSQYTLTRENLHLILQCSKLRKLYLCRIDKDGFINYCNENNILQANVAVTTCLDLTRTTYSTFRYQRQ